jgi:phosphoribosyl 1,2-cyclic phosphodiesterase
VGVITDIGRCCDEVVRQFSHCHAAFLESNYDADMLANGRYPAYLKQRIRGGEGHISNDEALALFVNHRSPAMSHLILSHLSANNNDPRIVEQVFRPHAGGVEVVVASRHEESRLYTVAAASATVAGKNRGQAIREALKPLKPSQLALF